MYNLHELAYGVSGYIQKIVTYPDLVCVCGTDEIIQEMNRVLLLNENGKLLSYDTAKRTHLAICRTSGTQYLVNVLSN